MSKLTPVLLAEDDEHDVFFMRHAFEKAGIQNQLIVVPNGQEAIRYLEGSGIYRDRVQFPEPGLLLLDLKMPVINGFEVLDWIRQQDHWRDHLGVIVLSSSAQDSDKRKAFELGAHEYLVKPSLNELVDLMRDVQRRWLQVASETSPVQRPATGRQPE